MSAEKSPNPRGQSQSLAVWVSGEALGCVLVMLVLIPLCAALEGRGAVLTAVLVHGVGVVAVDLLSAATLSPNFCLGLFLASKLSAGEAAVRALVDLLVCSACAPLLHRSKLLHLPLPAPAPGVSLSHAFLVEAGLACCFFVVILFIVNVIPTFEIRRPLVALTLRILITLGAPFTGAYFNPMIALPFALHHGRVDGAFLLVYCLGPVCGTVLGLVLWSALQVTVSSSDSSLSPSSPCSASRSSDAGPLRSPRRGRPRASRLDSGRRGWRLLRRSSQFVLADDLRLMEAQHCFWNNSN